MRDRALIEGLRSGDRKALAQAITLVESERLKDRQRGRDLLQSLLQDLRQKTSRSIRIGVTGIPGVGKSTFIDALGTELTRQDHRVAVLAVDPSSTVSGGSILADKTRMEQLSRDPKAFVRPTPGGRAAGGVAHATREAMLLCEAAGFDVVMVETVGVGQSEVSVARLVDSFVLLLLGGAGDELQGIKRGIMELADILVVHKADGENLRAAEQACRDYGAATKLILPRHEGWKPPVMTCSSFTGKGLEEVWATIVRHRAHLGTEGLEKQRRQQALQWFEEALEAAILQSALQRPEILAALPELRKKVLEGELHPTAAVGQIIK